MPQRNDVREQLRELTAPLAQQLLEIEREIKLRQTELSELRTARTDIEAVLKRLDPTFAATPKRAATAASMNKTAPVGLGQKLPLVRAYVERHAAEFPDGISPSDVWRGMQGNGSNVGRTTAREAMRALRDEGMLRLDRLGPGGSEIYKLVGPNHG